MGKFNSVIDQNESGIDIMSALISNSLTHTLILTENTTAESIGELELMEKSFCDWPKNQTSKHSTDWGHIKLVLRKYTHEFMDKYMSLWHTRHVLMSFLDDFTLPFTNQWQFFCVVSYDQWYVFGYLFFIIFCLTTIDHFRVISAILPGVQNYWGEHVTKRVFKSHLFISFLFASVCR